MNYNGEIINYTLDNNNVSIENNLEINLEDEELVFNVEIDNEINGKKEKKSFAAFVDQNNGTAYQYDSTEISASVAPTCGSIHKFRRVNLV